MSRRGAVGIVVLLGVALRLLQYGFNRSLWLDEALLAPTVLDHSLAELLSPSTWGPLPPGYLLLTKLSVVVLGEGEYALRLVPFLASLVSLALFWMLADRLLSRGGSLVAFALFALSPYLIYYASEVKPYSSDVLVSLAILLLAHRLYQRGVSTGAAALWFAAALTAVVFALTSVFVTAGASAALLAALARRRDWPGLTRLLAAGAAFAVALGVPYLLVARHAGQSEYLQAFWQSGFMPLPPRSLADLAWFPSTFRRLFEDPLGVIGNADAPPSFYHAAASMLAFAVGAFWMRRRNGFALLLLLLPVAFALLASGLRLYPFGGTWASAGRVILFLTPSFFLLMGEGAERLRVSLRNGLRPVAVALLVLLVAPPLAWGILAVPQPRAELKPLLGYVRESWEPGDLVYVHYDTRQTFRYYAPRFGFTQDQTVEGVCARFQPQRYLEELSQLRGRPRVWILFTGGKGAYQFDERGLILSYLDHIGARLDDQVSFGTSVYLYDLRPEQAQHSPFQVNLPKLPPRAEEGCALWS